MGAAQQCGNRFFVDAARLQLGYAGLQRSALRLVHAFVMVAAAQMVLVFGQIDQVRKISKGA